MPGLSACHLFLNFYYRVLRFGYSTMPLCHFLHFLSLVSNTVLPLHCIALCSIASFPRLNACFTFFVLFLFCFLFVLFFVFVGLQSVERSGVTLFYVFNLSYRLASPPPLNCNVLYCITLHSSLYRKIGFLPQSSYWLVCYLNCLKKIFYRLLSSVRRCTTTIRAHCVQPRPVITWCCEKDVPRPRPSRKYREPLPQKLCVPPPSLSVCLSLSAVFQFNGSFSNPLQIAIKMIGNWH